MTKRPNPDSKRRVSTPATAQDAGKRPLWQNPLAWIAVAAVLAVAVALALNSNDEDSDASATSETAFAEAIGTPLPPLAEPDPAIGAPAPTLSASTLDGPRVQLGADGVARVYGFFAHWCSHCQAELPRTAAWLRDRTLPDGVEVVAVSTAVDPGSNNYPPSAWFAREQWPAPVLIDDDKGSLADSMGLTAYPFWVAVDSDGNVAARASGELTDSGFEALVDAISPSVAQ